MAAYRRSAQIRSRASKIGGLLDPMYSTPRMYMISQNAASLLQHTCKLEIRTEIPYVRQTGIVCTIGPASREITVLEKMIEAGMTIARLNFSHGTHEYHAGSIANIREAVVQVTKSSGAYVPLAIVMDTKGPEIRTGHFNGGPAVEFELKKGDVIKLSIDKSYAEKGNPQCIYVDYNHIVKFVKIGNTVYLDDGQITLKCTNVGSNFITCKVEIGGVLGGNKNVNLPGVDVDLPAVSEQDVLDIKFGVKQGVDIVFASFIRNAVSIEEIRKALGGHSKIIKVVAKIENHQGLENIDEIVEAADGIMIARADLGIEMSPEKVFIAQKTIIARCNQAGKAVICATQMMETMVTKPRPSRAEGSDVANAVLEGVDCLMLSIETAKGEFPVEAIQIMADICMQAEAAIWPQQMFGEIVKQVTVPLDAAETMAISAVEVSARCLAAAIIVNTSSGKSAEMIAKYRPRCPIIGVTRNAPAARGMLLRRGILPLLYEGEREQDWLNDVDARVEFAIKYATKEGFAVPGDPVVIITGWKKGSGFANTMRMIYISPERVVGQHPAKFVPPTFEDLKEMHPGILQDKSRLSTNI